MNKVIAVALLVFWNCAFTQTINISDWDTKTLCYWASQSEGSFFNPAKLPRQARDEVKKKNIECATQQSPNRQISDSKKNTSFKLAQSEILQSNLTPCQGDNTYYWTNCFGVWDNTYGDKYVGEFKDGQRSGKGMLTSSRGNTYIGDFKDGMFDGSGISYITSTEEISKSGKWSKDRLISPIDVQQVISQLTKESQQSAVARVFQNKLNSSEKHSDWVGRVNSAVGSMLKHWFEEGRTQNLKEISPPEFPPALKLSQDKWETNKEFEDRIASLRIERQKEIERVQADYKTKVDIRNDAIQKLVLARTEKEMQLPIKKKELITQALQYLNLQVEAKSVSFDQESGALYIDVSIDKGADERYAFKDAPQQVRRDALTSTNSLILKPEFYVSDSGQFGIRAINIESSGIKVAGTFSQANASSQSLRLATIDVPVSNLPVLNQQSAITVDKNQVEQILYRDENESLRKRLEEQRKAQELALSEETRKVAAETAKLRAESETLRQRQRELESQLASGSKTPINYGKALNAHALIIGNASYGGSSKLPNPINDAKAMSGVLRGLGFTVTESLDADRTKLVTALSQFSRSAANADITLLFYAGHGVQISGTNYMLPIDLNLNDLSQVPLQGVSLNSVVEQYLPGMTKLVFLDACRDNPLMQTASRSVSRGLAPINVSEGTLISYSTKDGQVAQDGDGKNSPFTTALLQHLGDPDDIAVVLRKVREKVMKNTGGKQQPWEYGSLTGGALVLSAIKPIK